MHTFPWKYRWFLTIWPKSGFNLAHFINSYDVSRVSLELRLGQYLYIYPCTCFWVKYRWLLMFRDKVEVRFVSYFEQDLQSDEHTRVSATERVNMFALKCSLHFVHTSLSVLFVSHSYRHSKLNPKRPLYSILSDCFSRFSFILHSKLNLNSFRSYWNFIHLMLPCNSVLGACAPDEFKSRKSSIKAKTAFWKQK